MGLNKSGLYDMIVAWFIRLKGPQFAAGGAAGMLPLTWNKPVVFLGFASKDFGELGSLFERSEFEQVPKVCEQNRKKYPVCDGSGGRTAAPPAYL